MSNKPHAPLYVVYENDQLQKRHISKCPVPVPPWMIPGSGEALLFNGIQYINKYSPDQPRDYHGRWTSEGDTSTTEDKSRHEDMAQVSQISTKKQDFVDAHLNAADIGAKQLNVPVENILGLSALESGWGQESRFAQEGNNFFSLYYPAPYATGYMTAQSSGNKLATFASFEDSLQSFISTQGSIINGASDPMEFATRLQDSGKYGIDPDTGTKVATFVPNTVATINGLRPYIERSRQSQK